MPQHQRRREPAQPHPDDLHRAAGDRAPAQRGEVPPEPAGLGAAVQVVVRAHQRPTRRRPRRRRGPVRDGAPSAASASAADDQRADRHGTLEQGHRRTGVVGAGPAPRPGGGAPPGRDRSPDQGRRGRRRPWARARGPGCGPRVSAPRAARRRRGRARRSGPARPRSCSLPASTVVTTPLGRSATSTVLSSPDAGEVVRMAPTSVPSRPSLFGPATTTGMWSALPLWSRIPTSSWTWAAVTSAAGGWVAVGAVTTTTSCAVSSTSSRTSARPAAAACGPPSWRTRRARRAFLDAMARDRHQPTFVAGDIVVGEPDHGRGRRPPGRRRRPGPGRRPPGCTFTWLTTRPPAWATASARAVTTAPGRPA